MHFSDLGNVLATHVNNDDERSAIHAQLCPTYEQHIPRYQAFPSILHRRRHQLADPYRGHGGETYYGQAGSDLLAGYVPWHLLYGLPGYRSATVHSTQMVR